VVITKSPEYVTINLGAYDNQLWSMELTI